MTHSLKLICSFGGRFQCGCRTVRHSHHQCKDTQGQHPRGEDKQRRHQDEQGISVQFFRPVLDQKGQRPFVYQLAIGIIRYQ